MSIYRKSFGVLMSLTMVAGMIGAALPVNAEENHETYNLVAKENVKTVPNGAGNIADKIKFIKGKTRTETSYEASNLVNSKILVVANGYKYADSLSAYNIASKFNAKHVLVSETTDLSGYIKRNGIEKVYLIGGFSSISKNAENKIRNNCSNVVRLAGRNRYDTNEKTLIESGYNKVGVADGRNYPDALSASGLLKNNNLGLLLVDGGKNYSTSREVKYTFGGTNSVRQNGGKRLAGKNRYDTSTKISDEIIDNTSYINNVAITTGENPADALSAINITNLGGNSIVLLANKNNVYYRNIMSEAGAGYLIGGQVPKEVVNGIMGKSSNVKNNVVDNSTVNTETSSNTANNGAATNNGTGSNTTNNGTSSNTTTNGGTSSESEIKYFLIDDNGIKTERNTLPNGYVNLGKDKKSNNVLCIKKENVFSNKAELKKFLMSEIKKGPNNGYTIALTNDDIDDDFIKIIDKYSEVYGLSPNFAIKKTTESGCVINTIQFQLYTTTTTTDKRTGLFIDNGGYETSDMKKSLSILKEDIRKSGVLKKNSDKEKAVYFANWMQNKYKYNPIHDASLYTKEDELRNHSLYGLTILRNGEKGVTVCEGATYYFATAMQLMDIPVLAISNEYKTHALATVYIDGEWLFIDPQPPFDDNNIREKQLFESEVYYEPNKNIIEKYAPLLYDLQ